MKPPWPIQHLSEAMSPPAPIVARTAATNSACDLSDPSRRARNATGRSSGTRSPAGIASTTPIRTRTSRERESAGVREVGPHHVAEDVLGRFVSRRRNKVAEVDAQAV